MTALSRWLDRSLGRRIAAMVIVLLTITGGSLALVFYLQVHRVTERTNHERLRLLAGQLSEILGRGPATAVADLNRIAADPEVIALVRGTAPPASEPRALEGAVRGDTRRALAIVDRDGRMLKVKGSNLQPGWFGPVPAGLLEQRGGVGPEVAGFRSLGDSTLYYDVRVPVRHDGAVIGFLVSRFRVTGSTTTRNQLAGLLGTSTTLSIGGRSDGVWTDLAGPSPAPPPEALTPGAPTRFRTDREYIGYSLPVANTGWTVLVSAPRAQVMAPARVVLRNGLFFTGFAIAAGAIGAVLVGRRLSRPLKDITEATEHIAAGSFGSRADERSPGEVGRLARAFNVMADEVGASTQRLQESEASHRAFVAHASEGIWRLDFPGGIDAQLSAEEQLRRWYASGVAAECNPVLARMFGLQAGFDLVRIPFATLYPPDDQASLQVLQTFIARGHRCSGVETRQQRNGDAPHIYTHDLIGIIEDGRLCRIWGTRRDVTLARTLDERIAQTQRLESVGRLAGGIAHDFNNLLTVILADTEAMQEAGARESSELQEIEAAARRAAELTRQLLAFSRGQVLRPTVLDLNAVIRSFQGMLRRVIGEDVDLRLRLADRVAAVEADPAQIERVIMNLVVNARDAMPSGGTLEVRTEMVTLDEEYVHDRPGVHAGPYVLLAVTDTGVGMSEETRRNAFEPFFTTKPKGRGTGLGLASVYGMVRQSGGDITLYSEPGQGTTVKIFLPAAVDSPVLPSPPGRRDAAAPAAGGTLLLVEDDPAVRRMVRRSLGGQGYRVIEAEDGERALQTIADAGGDVDVVLTDMVMPGLSGAQLVEQIRARWPRLGIVMMSGYSGGSYAGTEPMPADVGFLEKPFAVADLRAAIQAAIRSSRRVDGSPADPVS